VLSVCLGWYVERAHRQARAVREILKHSRGSVTYDFECQRTNSVEAKSWVPPRILACTGPDLFHTVVIANIGEWYPDEHQEGPDADDVRRQLAALPNLRGLHLGVGAAASDECLAAAASLSNLEWLHCFNATDAGIAHLPRLHRLKSLANHGSGLTDESLRVLGTMPQLEELSLPYGAFSDDGLDHIGRLKRLTRLTINNGASKYTDAGLVHLEGLHRLEQVSLSSPFITPAGVMRLKRAIPDLLVMGTSPPPTIEELRRKGWWVSLPYPRSEAGEEAPISDAQAVVSGEVRKMEGSIVP